MVILYACFSNCVMSHVHTCLCLCCFMFISSTHIIPYHRCASHFVPAEARTTFPSAVAAGFRLAEGKAGQVTRERRAMRKKCQTNGQPWQQPLANLFLWRKLFIGCPDMSSTSFIHRQFSFWETKRWGDVRGVVSVHFQRWSTCFALQLQSFQTLNNARRINFASWLLIFKAIIINLSTFSNCNRFR